MTSADSPRRHRNRDFLDAKLSRIDDPHVAPLNDFVRDIRSETGGEVPWFDPAGGGVMARALVLLEAPGARSTSATGPRKPAGGSGIISPDNDDQTAANSWQLYRDAGLLPSSVVIWNIVPWYIGSTSRIRAATRDDVTAAGPYLNRLLALLPEMRVVLAMGDRAREGWLRYLLTSAGPLLPTLACPHPSPQVLNPHPEYRDLIRAALDRVAAVVAD